MSAVTAPSATNSGPTTTTSVKQDVSTAQLHLGSEANFSTALTTWKEINLSDLQKTLDTTALELVESQKESMVGRKKLAEQTREFRKLPDDDTKLNAIKTLLKSYQTEIDSLTRRSKFSESAFLNVYKLLAEAPDPYPLLDAAVDQTVKVAEARMVESELQRLREENGEMKKQLSDMAGLDDKRKKAEQKASDLESKMDDLIRDKISQKENELNAQYDERLRNYEEREKDLQKQVSTLRSQLKDMYASNENTQAKLVDASQRQDQDVAARLAELDLVVADLERANERVASVERRNEMLRSEIESVRSGSEQQGKVKALETQIEELEAEAGRMLTLLEEIKSAKTEIEIQARRQREEAKREIASLTSEFEACRAKLKQFSDYDEIKRELEIMKFVEFSGVDAEADDPQMPNPNADKENQKNAKSLENLLATKNKRLQDEMTRLRVSNEELLISNDDLVSQLTEAEADSARLKTLNERLEDDLLQINRGATNVSGGSEQGDSGTGKGTITPGIGGLAGLDLGTRSSAHESGKATPTDNSILPIVTSQRDRFRQRNAELEEELRKQFEGVSDLRAEIKSLQADNLKLYEKVRYMQSYREPSANASAGPSNSSGLAGVMRSGRDEEMGRYKDKYEESMNPFEAFKGREAQRAIQALNPLERGVFALTRAVVGNKRARNLFILYAGSLHLLVIWVLYECMGASVSNENSPIPMKPIGP